MINYEEYRINLRDLFTMDIRKLPTWVYWDSPCIYKITNKLNNKVYIGQARDFYNRFRNLSAFSHLRELRFIAIENINTRTLYNSILLHGSRNFDVEIISEPTTESLNDLEKYWIAHYDSTNRSKGYNLTLGGDDCSHLHTPEMMKARSDKYNGDVCGMMHTDEVWESKAKRYNGDVMGMCHTPEAIKTRLESDRANHGGVLAFNTEDAIQNSINTRRKLYGDDIMSPCHTPEAIRLSHLYQGRTLLFDNINRRLNYLKSNGLKVDALNYYKYPIIKDHHDRSIQTHVDRVLDQMYLEDPINSDIRWTSEMESIFKWFDSYPDWNSIEQIIYSSDQ